jgi:Zn-dependent metalloprotease
MKGYVDTAEDNGGVHVNSGIPNRAFCLAALAIGGSAWERAGRIWYLALTEMLSARSDFRAAARATFEVAKKLHGPRGGEAKAVADAWKAVGVK